MKSSITAYPTEARATYMSCTAALIIPAGIAFAAGFYGGFAAFSLLWSLAILYSIPNMYVVRLSLIVAAASALVAWVLMIRWWRRTVQDVEQFGAALVASRVRQGAPLIIEHVSNEGRTIQRERVPFTEDQLKMAAGVLIPKRGRFDLRSMYEIFGQDGAVKFRDWMVNHPREYAIMDDRGWVQITGAGLDFLRATKHAAPPPPQDGEMIPLYTSRR